MKSEREGLMVTGALAAFTAAIGLSATGLSLRAALVPSIVAVVTLLILVSLIVGQIRGGSFERRPGNTRDEPVGDLSRSESVLMSWMALLLVLVWALGMPVALPLFLFAFLKIRSRESWTTTLASSAACWIVMAPGLGGLLQVDWPAGALWAWLE